MTAALSWLAIVGLYFAVTLGLRYMDRRHARRIETDLLRARLDADTAGAAAAMRAIIGQQTPLDPRDVDLWARQILSADADQIMAEVTR